MLIALFTVLLLGGSASFMLDYVAEARDNVKIVMPKGERQKAALGTLKAMKQSERAYRKHLRTTAKELYKAIDLPDDVESEIDTVWTAHFAEVQRQNHEMLDLRFELREQLTREEWGAVFSSETAEQDHRQRTN